jgi:hypothetical protein
MTTTREEDEEEELDIKEEPRHSVVFKVEGLQYPPSPLFLTWLSESLQTPWLQKTEPSTVVIPLTLDLVQIPGECTPQDEGLCYLILFLYTFV